MIRRVIHLDWGEDTRVYVVDEENEFGEGVIFIGLQNGNDNEYQCVFNNEEAKEFAETILRVVTEIKRRNAV